MNSIRKIIVLCMTVIMVLTNTVGFADDYVSDVNIPYDAIANTDSEDSDETLIDLYETDDTLYNITEYATVTATASTAAGAASNAVDGDNSTSWVGKNGREHLKLDFGTPVSVKKITYYLTNIAAQARNPVTIYGANEDDLSDKTELYKFTEQIPSNTSRTIDVDGTRYRYIVVWQNDQSGTERCDIAVSEIAVYSETEFTGDGPDFSKLKNYELLKDKEEINISYIGGSITEGAGASNIEKCWASLVTNSFKKAFKNKTVNGYNVGIGETASDFGLMRLEKDVISKNPDIVFVEFTVNDNFSEEFKSTIDITGLTTDQYGKNPQQSIKKREATEKRVEGIVQKLKQMPNPPMIVFVYTTTAANGRWIEPTEVVVNHYGLNAIDLKDTVDAYVEGGSESGNFFADGTHPSDVGHKLYADTIMQKICTEPDVYLKRADDVERIYPYSRNVISSTYVPASDMEKTGEWRMLGATTTPSVAATTEVLASNNEGASLSYSFYGSAISVAHRIGKLCGSADLQIVNSFGQTVIKGDLYTFLKGGRDVNYNSKNRFSNFLLPEDNYTLTLTVKNDGYVAIDGIYYGLEPNAPTPPASGSDEAYEYEDITSKATVKASESTSSGAPANAVDGNNATNWIGKNGKEYLMLDFGKKVSVNRIYYHLGSMNIQARNPVTIYGSNNGDLSDKVELYKFTDIIPENTTKSIAVDGSEYRYIVVWQNDQTGTPSCDISVGEIRVFSEYEKPVYKKIGQAYNALQNNLRLSFEIYGQNADVSDRICMMFYDNEGKYISSAFADDSLNGSGYKTVEFSVPVGAVSATAVVFDNLLNTTVKNLMVNIEWEAE